MAEALAIGQARVADEEFHLAHRLLVRLGVGIVGFERGEGVCAEEESFGGGADATLETRQRGRGGADTGQRTPGGTGRAADLFGIDLVHGAESDGEHTFHAEAGRRGNPGELFRLTLRANGAQLFLQRRADIRGEDIVDEFVLQCGDRRTVVTGHQADHQHIGVGADGVDQVQVRSERAICNSGHGHRLFRLLRLAHRDAI